MVTRPRVVIVGGGFGGLACARALDGEAVDVLLLDQENYHLFTPLLYQVATALLNPSDIAFPFRARFRRSPNVRFQQDRVDRIEPKAKRVHTRDREAIPYDHLVVATGSTNNYFGDQELASATLGMKTLEEALRLRNHVLSCLELASQVQDEAERRPLLTFVIVGGGPTGVEYAGALVELLKVVLGRDYPSLRPAQARIVLVEGRDRLLEAFPAGLGRYAERTLGRRGVQVRTGALMARASDRLAVLSTGEEIPTATIVWAAGVRPHLPESDQEPPLARSYRVEVTDGFRVGGWPGAFAIGDVAGARQDGGELPMLSPVAMQAGRYVARSILDELRPGPPAPRPPFRYVDKGNLATIGRNAAVGKVGKLQFTGFVGWMAWLTVHIYYLVGFRNRLVVLSSWGWNYLRKDRPIRIITRAEPDPLTEELIEGRTLPS